MFNREITVREPWDRARWSISTPSCGYVTATRFWWECTDRDRAWSAATVDKPRLSWTNKFYFVFRLPGIWYWHLMPSPQSCTEALLIESGGLCILLQKAALFASDPPPPQMIRIHATFYVRWHRILKFVMLIQGVRAFCNSGWPDSGKFGWIDCWPYSTSLCPYSQNIDVQIEATTNPMHYWNFWNCQWAKEQCGEWS